VDFERGARDPIENTLRAIRAALEEAGVTFGDGGCICPPEKRRSKKK
jgi:hypothetical protein